MNRPTPTTILLTAILATSTTRAGTPDAINSDAALDFVVVSDQSNPAYPGFGSSFVGRGSVDYPYRIMRTEVNTEQWLTFFNLFVAQDPSLTDDLRPISWGTQVSPIGPLYNLNPFLTYPELSPILVNSKGAAMYCNWLHNGRTSDIASLMDGAYDISTFPQNPDGTYNAQEHRHPDARYWIPDVDEHLKAFFYDPDKNGEGPGWWYYAFRSDDPPVAGLPGVGHVPRDLEDKDYVAVAGEVGSPLTFPLGFYPDVQSPWGLLDTLGVSSERLEDFPPGREGRSRYVRGSSNLIPIDFLNDWIWSLQRVSPRSPAGLRIAARLQTCGAADLAEPYGTLDMTDVLVFLEAFGERRTAANLAGPGGVWDVDDLLVFLAAFTQGCVE